MQLSVVELAEGDESLRKVKMEMGELVFEADEGLEGLFDKFSREVEECYE